MIRIFIFLLLFCLLYIFPQKQHALGGTGGQFVCATNKTTNQSENGVPQGKYCAKSPSLTSCIDSNTSDNNTTGQCQPNELCDSLQLTNPCINTADVWCKCDNTTHFSCGRDQGHTNDFTSSLTCDNNSCTTTTATKGFPCIITTPVVLPNSSGTPILLQNAKNPCPGNKCDTAIGIIDVSSGQSFVTRLFQVVLSLVGTIALLLIIYSGYSLSMSQGNPEKVKGAQETLTSAIVGLIFVILSLVILQIIGVDILRIPGFS